MGPQHFCTHLSFELQTYAAEELEKKSKKISKEEVEQVFFNILYDSFMRNDDREKFLRTAFDNENPELMAILQENMGSSHMAKLRDEVSQFLIRNFGPEHYNTLRDAIAGVLKKGLISGDDKDIICDLNFNNDKQLLAAWDTYLGNFSEDELVSSFRALIQEKKVKADKKPSEGFGIMMIKNVQEASQPEEAKEQPRIEPHGQADQREAGDQSSQNLSNEVDYIEGAEGEEDPEYQDDLDGIMQFQHQILRKYAMYGIFKYSALPLFHSLVKKRDYKMVCIFEVFAQNRNVDDFLENLGIYSQQKLPDNQEEEQGMDP